MPERWNADEGISHWWGKKIFYEKDKRKMSAEFKDVHTWVRGV